MTGFQPSVLPVMNGDDSGCRGGYQPPGCARQMQRSDKNDNLQGRLPAARECARSIGLMLISTEVFFLSPLQAFTSV